MKAAPMVASCASVVQETFEEVEINTPILRTSSYLRRSTYLRLGISAAQRQAYVVLSFNEN